MGLRPATKIRYVRVSDGTSLGVAKRSAKDSTLTVDTLPSTPASQAAGVAVSAASSGLLVTKPLPPVVKAKPDPAPTSTTAKKGSKNASKKSTGTAAKSPGKSSAAGKHTPAGKSGTSSKSTK